MSGDKLRPFEHSEMSNPLHRHQIVTDCRLPILLLGGIAILASCQRTAGATPPSSAPADTLDFTGRLAPISPDNIFRDPGHYVWCGSIIRGEDDKYYMFYSRWRIGSEGRAPGDVSTHKNMSGWIKYCEIAVAVSPGPTGPFRPLGVVFKGSGDPKRWDYLNAHNPHVKRFGGKVYLYYIAISNVPSGAPWMQLANNQRIGVAVADSVSELAAGRFKRCDQPLVSTDGVNTFCRVVNPSVTRGRDGRYLMMFKSRDAKDQHMTLWIAESEKPDGPFQLSGPALTDARYEAEDPYFWYDQSRDRYYAIVKDYAGASRSLSPQYGALALITSKKGWGDWQPAVHPLVSLRKFLGADGREHSLNRLERPQLVFDNSDRPVALACAAAEEDPQSGVPTFNLIFPITHLPQK